MLEIRVLSEQRVVGGPASGGRPPSSRALALLAYLVLHAGAPQARSRLAGLFWPDSGESQARTNLRRELHNLRSLLGDDPSLVVESASLRWQDTPSCRVDVRVFAVEREAALAARSAQDRDGRLLHAEAAIAEYRGELLPGMHDDWVHDQRERLRRECVDLCDVAVGIRRDRGQRIRAAEIARRRIRLEPLEEAGYRALMELQAASGDLAAAISTYHRCAALLEQELGVGPDPETTAMVERLLGRRGGSAPARAVAAGGSRRIGAAGAGLIGRDREVGLLLQRWHQAGCGSSGLVVVSGEAGVGKSRLVAELTAVAGADGAVVATTRCFALSGRLALAPIAEWLRGSRLQEAVAALEPVWRVEVERLVPDPVPIRRETPAVSRTRPVAGARAVVDAWQRHRFFEGLARAVLSANRPTLLVLDDLQWCDQETVAWLAFLLGFAGDARLLVAATLRSEELEQNRDVATALRSLRSAGRITDLPLGPLDPAGTGQLAASLLGRTVDAAEQALLHATTGGYPLYVVEAARSLPDQAGSGQPLPAADLQAVLRHRLEQASPAAQEVAGLAAAFGRDFSLDLLSEAGDLEPEALVGAVDELWRRRILREQRGGYDFSHDLLRDAAYASVSPARRWLLHRRLAQGLELLHAGHLDDVAAQLAEQYDRGGRSDRALHYFARAAEVAAAVFAHAEAVRHHRRCLDLVRRLPAGRDRDRRELEVLQAMSAPLNAARGYSSPDLQATLERSVTLAQRLDRPQALLRNLVGLFAVRFVQGHVAQSHQLATRALALDGADPAAAGQAHFAFAGSATTLGRPGIAVEHFDLAIQLSTGEISLVVGNRPEVHAQAWAAHAHWLLGNDDQAALRCADAVERGRAADHPYSLAISLAYAAITHQVRGDTVALRAVAEELRRLCRRYEFAYYGEWAMIMEGWAAGGERGVTRIEEGIGRLRSRGAYARMPYWLSLLAQLLIGCGRPDAARAVLDAARASAEQRGDRWWLPEVLRLRAGLEPGAAVDMLRRAADLAVEQRSRALEARCRADLAGSGVRDADPPGSRGER
ncbi:ATP-binding protein [Pseudonocardia acidicola]|uniref:AAA family ATPase n=1 Tax=Pseudonocardia acidicola TaxID=2724939 RepID=A0ABX1S8N4_9PSEU|nr:AAA family ATPase [Pseudonocardia acidicola]NMH97926.1 AAA family ATPase [Pseudonocardia acidicola]